MFSSMLHAVTDGAYHQDEAVWRLSVSASLGAMLRSIQEASLFGLIRLDESVISASIAGTAKVLV